MATIADVMEFGVSMAVMGFYITVKSGWLLTKALWCNACYIGGSR
jgi:hypothetical protein